EAAGQEALDRALYDVDVGVVEIVLLEPLRDVRSGQAQCRERRQLPCGAGRERITPRPTPPGRDAARRDEVRVHAGDVGIRQREREPRIGPVRAVQREILAVEDLVQRRLVGIYLRCEAVTRRESVGLTLDREREPRSDRRDPVGAPLLVVEEDVVVVLLEDGNGRRYGQRRPSERRGRLSRET